MRLCVCARDIVLQHMWNGRTAVEGPLQLSHPPEQLKADRDLTEASRNSTGMHMHISQGHKIIYSTVLCTSVPLLALQMPMMLKNFWKGLGTKCFWVVCTVLRIIEPCERCKHDSHKLNRDMPLL